MNASTIRHFQRAAYAWIAFYALALLVLGQAAWTNAPVDLFVRHNGIGGTLQTFINGLSPLACMMLCALVIGLCISLFRQHRWWLALLVWLCFRILSHRTWLASNGGIQLMENMLLWSALMSASIDRPLTVLAFWAARLQLLLVYAVAAAHKFTGHAWLDGSAVLTVANDNDFHLHWLAVFPMLCMFLTYATLAFMALFPLAVWWSPSRRIFLIIGAIFHLCTAIFMGIPQMGFAFIACYALWLNEEEAQWMTAWPKRALAHMN